MADWTTIADSQVDPKAPVTSELMAALRDNPIAIAEGATGAPRIWLPAFERLEVGSEVRSRDDAESAGASSYVGHSFNFIQHGTIRVTFQHRAANSRDSAVVYRTRAGSKTPVASYTNTTSYVTRTVDVPVIPGDRVSIEYVGSNNNGYLRNIRFQTNGQDLWPGAEANVEGNRSAT